MIDAYIEGVNSFLIIIIYGSLLLLSFLMITNTLRVNKKANLGFGIFLFIWSTYWLEEIFVFTNAGLMGSSTIIVLRSIQFFTPIVFYYGIVNYTNPDFKFEKIVNI